MANDNNPLTIAFAQIADILNEQTDLLTRQQEDLKQAADELHVWKSAAIAGLARHGICTPVSMSDFHPSDLTNGLRQLAALQAKPETDNERCGHFLCGREKFERDTADAECMLDDCPFRPAPTEARAEKESPLAKAVRDARGGPAPTQFRGFA